MPRHTNGTDESDRQVNAAYDRYGIGRLPHIIWEDKPEKPGTTNAWITSDTMYDLDRVC